MKNLQELGVCVLDSAQEINTTGGCGWIGSHYFCPGEYLKEGGKWVLGLFSGISDGISDGIKD